jgi:hypothetical protein
VKLAIERGAPDNVTVIVARVERAPDGDSTIIDDPHMDDTQDIDPTAFDETVREGEAREPRPSPAASRHPLPEGEGESLTQSPLPPGEGGAERSEATGEGRASTGMLPTRWLLLLVLFLGAAGAWLLFSR